MLNYRPDGITPYMLFFKDGVISEKCVSTLQNVKLKWVLVSRVAACALRSVNKSVWTCVQCLVRGFTNKLEVVDNAKETNLALVKYILC